MRRRIRTTVLAHAALLALLSTQAVAQDAPAAPAAAASAAAPNQLDVIVVSARRRLEVGQNVPVALTALSADAMRQQQVVDLESLNLSVPNVTVVRNTGTAVGAQVYMRGIGNDDSSFTSEPPIGIYLDDVYIGRQIGAMLDILEFDSIEFLRGPQGTLYGRNSSGGAVKYQSRRPRLQGTELGAGLTLGSFKRRDFNFSANLPLVEGAMAVKLDVGHRKQDGFITVVDASGRDTGQRANGVDSTAARLSLRWAVSEKTDLFASIDGSNNRSGPQTIVSTNCTGLNGLTQACPFRFGPYTSGQGAPDINRFDGWGGNVTLQHDLGWASLKSITGYRGFRDDVGLDLSGNPAAPFVLVQYLAQKQFSQELQLASPGNGALRWIAGLFYFDEKVDQDALFGGVRNVDHQEAKSYAVFGEAYWTFLPGATLTLGGRQSKDEKTITRAFYNPATAANPTATLPPGDNAYDGSKFTPRVAIDYAPAKDMLLYASAGSGYRAGGFAAARPTSVAQLSGKVDAETAKTVEAGFKSELLNRTLRFNAAVFSSKYKNLQSSILGANGSFSVVSGDVSFSGVELETAWRPAENVTLYALAGFLHDRWDRKPTGTVVGDRLKHVPREQFKLGGDWRIPGVGPGAVVLAANYRHTSEIYRSTANHVNILSPAYGLLDAQAGWETSDRKYRVTLAGQNLTDKLYYTQGVSTLGRYVGMPRTYSVSLNMRI